MAGEDLKRLWEQFLQLELIDSHEEAGNLTAKTARGYRLHVLRGGSIYVFPLDGSNAQEFVQRWNETRRALQRDHWTGRSPELSVRNRPSRRAPRRRSVRTNRRAQTRSPGSRSDDSPEPPPLRVAPFAAFRREPEKAGL